MMIMMKMNKDRVMNNNYPHFKCFAPKNEAKTMTFQKRIHFNFKIRKRVFNFHQSLLCVCDGLNY
jgi:hypothetical protein